MESVRAALMAKWDIPFCDRPKVVTSLAALNRAGRF